MNNIKHTEKSSLYEKVGGKFNFLNYVALGIVLVAALITLFR
jgi:hypothetical protein